MICSYASLLFSMPSSVTANGSFEIDEAGNSYMMENTTKAHETGVIGISHA